MGRMGFWDSTRLTEGLPRFGHTSQEKLVVVTMPCVPMMLMVCGSGFMFLGWLRCYGPRTP
jgi:hypothetical protein